MIPQFKRAWYELNDELRTKARTPCRDRLSIRNALDRCHTALEKAADRYEQRRKPDKHNDGIMGQQMALAALRDLVLALRPDDGERLATPVHDVIVQLDNGHRVKHRPRASNTESRLWAAIMVAADIEPGDRESAISKVLDLVSQRAPHCSARMTPTAFKTWQRKLQDKRDKSNLHWHYWRLHRTMMAKRSVPSAAVRELVNLATTLANTHP
jgi:hypothetical protein